MRRWYICGTNRFWDAPDIDNEIFITPTGGRHLTVGEFVNVLVTDAAEYDLYGGQSDYIQYQ